MSGFGNGFVAALVCGLVLSVAAHGQEPPAASTSAPAAAALPDWLFPPNDSRKRASESTEIHHLEGSAAGFTTAQTLNLYSTPDWYPDEHPPMPEVVAHGRKPIIPACGFCHLPNGEGRPENSSLAGYSSAYLKRQMAAFRDGVRQSADPSGTSRMILIAKNLTDEELDAAAQYFSGLTYRPWIKVIETDTVPKIVAYNRMLFFQPGTAPEPLGERIIETTTDLERTDLRDPHFGFVAYAPVGSIAAGKALSAPCANCHGKTLKGQGEAPPLAGRSPSYALRQLYEIQHGLRGGLAAKSMSKVLAPMTQAQLIDIAAYAASLEP